MIISFLANLIASLTILPFLSFILFYVLIYLYTKSKKDALQWAMFITTFFLFFSVSQTIEQLWNISLGWLLILLVLLILIGLTYLQFIIHGQIRYTKLIKGAFAISFLLFLPIHILLYLWVILSSFTQSIFSSS